MTVHSSARLGDSRDPLEREQMVVRTVESIFQLTGGLESRRSLREQFRSVWPELDGGVPCTRFLSSTLVPLLQCDCRVDTGHLESGCLYGRQTEGAEAHGNLVD